MCKANNRAMEPSRPGSGQPASPMSSNPHASGSTPASGTGGKASAYQRQCAGVNCKKLVMYMGAMTPLCKLCTMAARSQEARAKALAKANAQKPGPSKPAKHLWNKSKPPIRSDRVAPPIYEDSKAPNPKHLPAPTRSLSLSRAEQTAKYQPSNAFKKSVPRQTTASPAFSNRIESRSTTPARNDPPDDRASFRNSAIYADDDDGVYM
jgi:hypothetical protein